uniref:ABC transporter substrate-binding protein n=1 Tax=Solibacter usitatus (strain Ellin6076) TaxID=234267 RepID=Q01RI7_SOLUE
MRLKSKLALVALCLVMAASSVEAAQPSPLTTGIVQTVPGVGTFTGALTTTAFQATNGVLNAVGTLSGTLTNTTGQVIGTLSNAPITIPLTGLTGSCPILSLHTGQINLSLLGLNVTLSPIDLVITAQAAPGNLLGNLLCAVAHLLDTNGSLSGIVTLLNQILAAL